LERGDTYHNRKKKCDFKIIYKYKTIIKTNNLKIQDDGQGTYTLKIHKVKPKDAGTYACKAFSQGGSVKCTANLLVKSMLKGSTNSKPISSVSSVFKK
jgi:hypothetical protein